MATDFTRERYVDNCRGYKIKKRPIFGFFRSYAPVAITIAILANMLPGVKKLCKRISAPTTFASFQHYPRADKSRELALNSLL